MAWRTERVGDNQRTEDPIVQAALGHRELEAHHLPAAIDHLQHSLHLNPCRPACYTDLSLAQKQSGQLNEA
jgi:hypothetical protein